MKIKKTATLLLVLALVLSGCASGVEEPASTTLATEEVTDPVTQPTETEPPTTEPEPTETEPPEEYFYLTFAGDCTFGGEPKIYYAPWGFLNTVKEDYGWPFRNVLEWFENDDFTMVNLEGVLCDSGNPVDKKFTFRGPTDFVNILTQNSVEAVTLANNHSLDYGWNGYASTKATLEEAGMPYLEKQTSLLYTTGSGLTIGIYAEEYTAMDLSLLTRSVAELREQGAELIVYAVHWGAEGHYYPQDHQIEYAHQVIDAGVDIIYGSHPHVLQHIEEYNGGIIYYSLGNFSFGGNMYPKDLDTALLRQQVIRQGDEVRLGELEIVPCSCSSIPVRNNYQPTPYEEGSEEYQRVLDKLAGLWKGKATGIG